MMVKKKEKAPKQAVKKDAGKRKGNVVIHTGLPPKVEGQLRCYCCLAVSQIKWSCPSPPDVTHVRVRWWGEDGDGAIFRPYDARKGNLAMAKTLAKYPIKSGPKQFAAYLTDMSSLLIEVLSGGMMVPVGFAEVTDVGKISPTSPIKGWFPVMSPNDDKLAEIEISLNLETVADSYDSLGDTIPTTDIGMDVNGANESMYPQRIQHKPCAVPPKKPTDDPFVSPVSHQNGSVPNGHANTAADLRKQLNYSFHDNHQYSHPQPVQSGSSVEVSANGDIVTSDLDQNHLNFISHPTPNHSAVSLQSPSVLHRPKSTKKKSSNRIPHSQSVANGSDAPVGGDLLSILLQKGDKLRKEMIISSIEDSVTQSREIPGAAQRTELEEREVDLSRMSESRQSTGSFFKEILRSEKSYKNERADVSQFDENAIDLIMGGTGLDDLKMLAMGARNPGYVSDDMDLVSDPGDPIHNETLLKELFYKNPDSEVSELSELSEEEVTRKNFASKPRTASPAPSMEDPDNARPPSRRSSVSSVTLPLPITETPKTTPKKKTEKLKTPKRKGRVKLRRKGSKKRRKGSRSRSSASELSDNDSVYTSRSEMSQVSFDMPASDLDEPEQEAAPRPRKKKVDGLSVERLTLLGRVHVARVAIDQLKLVGHEQNTTPSKRKPASKSVGRPPKPSPKAKKAVTYFIEYQFPVVATSRDKHAPNAMATEVMRVASKNVKDGVVSFNHRSVFPIMFDGTAVDNWWKSALVFKLFARSAGQKVPNQVGSCGVPLKSILKSDTLHLDCSLDVQENSVNRSSISSRRGSDVEGFYGKLKVSVELASDNKDFSSALAKTKLAEMSGKAKIVPIPKPPPPKPPTVPQEPSTVNTHDQVMHFDQLRRQTESDMKESIVREVESFLQRNSQPSSVTSSQQRNFDHGLLHIPVTYDQSNLPEVLTLHTLLLIPEGRNITLSGIPCLTSLKRHPIFPPKPHTLVSDPAVHSMNSRNTYLVCRMFWCDDAVHSDVCWSDPQPPYNFSQIAPVLVSQSLLERMRNNFMIIEVWDKKTNSENDKLIGIVKLSLHQFYMSFRDRKISSALLKSQYPVIAVDNYLPIVDPLSGTQFGQLKVLLAMGSGEQVSALQRMKMENAAGLHVVRPAHQLNGNMETSPETSARNQFGTSVLVEHIFEVVIEGIRGLSMFDNMMWGEADCFIQYHFPTQTQTGGPGAPIVRHSVPQMKTFRSATTLCIPDPTFNDITRHRMCLPQGSPVQRELLSACAGSGSSGGIPFEIWCRYYHPNVRDQCIAKTYLPLAKLCAMVTMQKRNEPAVQTFSLQINAVPGDGQEDPEQQAKQKDCGLLTLTIHYKTHTVHNDTSTAARRNIGQSQVCLTVGILKACGLKAAAEALAYTDSGMQYPAEVGVNTYIKVQLSFLDKSEERISRTVARSFTPQFSHTMDFPCNLLWTEADDEALSLAEVLERGQLKLEVWHQVPGLASDIDRQMLVEGDRDGGRVSDVLLGTCDVPLSSLLTHRTGISGWFPVSLVSNTTPEENMDAEGYHGNYLHRVVGGVELEVKFAHHNDREKVIQAGRGVGWSPVDQQVEDEEEWMSDDESSGRFYNITIGVDQANFPLANALATGHDTLEKAARCYVRYKLYDRAAVVSKVTKMADSEGILTSELGHKHTLQIAASSPFRWFLREEKLEIQVWVSYSYNQSHRPQLRDKLIGTAYVALETLADQRRTQHRVSGLYPLFKAGGANLGGAFIQAHVTLKPMFGVPNQRENEASMVSDIHDTDYDPNDSFHQLTGQSKRTKLVSKPARLQEEDEEVVTSFSVLISVERAMHLPRVSEHKRSGEHLPNSYVSYQAAESDDPTCTDVIPNSDNPVWDHQNETRLSTQLLYQENKNLVFKVWHKPSSCGRTPDKSSDRVLGFVSVDLTPLASGLQLMCGWYNITDFNGQCQGQIKVNIIPQECLRQYNQDKNSSDQPSSLPVRSDSSVHHLPSWIHEQPMSFPLSDKPFSSSLSHFEPSSLPDLHQSHALQQQLVENIRHFLDQQQTTLDSKPDFTGISTERREPSIHWVPKMPEHNFEEPNDSSRSILFNNLRKQMQDLDHVTSRLKQKLSPVFSLPQQFSSEPEAPASCRSTGHATLTSTHSGLSTISTLHLQQSQRDSSRTHESELLLTVSNEGESSRTGVDSGVLSVTQSSEKYQDPEALDSQRSDGLDTFRLRSLTRDFNKDSPRDHNNSDTGIHCPYTGHEDHSSSNSNVGNTPRESHSKNSTPRGLSLHSVGSTPRDPYSVSNRSKMSDPSSLGFQYQGDMSSRSQMSGRNGIQDGGGGNVMPGIANENNSNNVNFNSDEKKMGMKDMSVIEENADESGGEGDEKYYHRYRDILDEQDSEGSEDESEADVVVPRTLNDVSGKFGGIPGHDGRSAAGPRESPREFHYTDHTMPFDVRSDSRSGSKSNSGSKKTSEGDLTDREELPIENLQDSRCDKHQFYVEKDSWFSDEEVDLQRSVHEPSYGPGSTKSNPLEAQEEENHQEMVEKDSWFSSDHSKSNLDSSNFPNEDSESNIPRNSKHLLSKVKLDTISSVGSREYDSFYTEERDLLNNVELDSVTSGTNTQKGESVHNSTASFHARRSTDHENFTLEGSTTDSIPKSPKLIYDHVVNELEEFFEQSKSGNVQNQFTDDCESEQSGEFVHSNEPGNRDNDVEEFVQEVVEEVEIQMESTNGDIVSDNGQLSDNGQQIPNFFLPVEHLQESMKVLHLATKGMPANQPKVEKEVCFDRREEKSHAAAEMKNKLSPRFSTGPVRGRQLPTAEEAKRIAKIFSSKAS